MSLITLPVPHIKQQNRGECLAACALMALTYLGLSMSYEQAVSLLQIRYQFGTPAYNIRRLEQLGVTVGYQQGTLAELYDHLANNQPCIVFVKTAELPYWKKATDSSRLPPVAQR